ncbi:multiple sugar transport system substrate-binding protein [Candidatus Termititenax persephonae]|uniref:Multiple sugar transport system substrate-binding protein n=1 Tax=Candidatus Termititenax persephonae TaxID=2218525 RepID=A0A388TGR8_9BACT|nr:multiple sugar transport system substrate-binding protein [Candidatus Termititenax persephonae]
MATALVCLSLFGCGGKDAEKTKLVMWIMPNSQEPVNDVRNVLRPFLLKNPDIEVEIVALDWGSAWQKITTAATSKDAPDIVQLGTTWVGAIGSMGAMLDVSENIQAAGGGQNLFVDAAWSTVGLPGSAEVFAVPWIVDTRVLFYRTDVFKRLGLTAQDVATWESFEATLRKIKEADLTIENKHIEPLGITGKNDWNVIHNLAPWIWANGGSFLAEDYASSVVNSAAAQKGLMFYIDLVKKGLVPLQCVEQNSYQIASDFNNGIYAMYFDGPYSLKGMTTPPERGGGGGTFVAKNFAVAPYPAGPAGRYTFCGGSNLAIFKSTKHQEAAWRVVQYLTLDEKAQIAYSQMAGFLPAKKAAFEDSYFTRDPFRRIFAEALRASRAYPCIPAWGQFETVVLTRQFGLMWDDVVRNLESFSVPQLKARLDGTKAEMDVILQTAVRDSGNEQGSWWAQRGDFHSQNAHWYFLLLLLVLLVLAVLFIKTVRRKGWLAGVRAVYRKYRLAYIFIAPAVFCLILLHLLPLLQGIWMSLLRVDQFTISQYLSAPFVGFKNYYDIFFNSVSPVRLGFISAVRNTIFYAVIVTFGTLGIGMIVAQMLNRSFKGRNVMRGLFLFPWIVPTFVVGMLWGFMWQKETGIINIILYDILRIQDWLGWLGVGADKPFWLMGDPKTLAAIIIPTVWRGWPHPMLMLLAGLQGISSDYYEAADIDGANGWKKFWYISFPLLKPVWAILLLFGLIFNVYAFNIVYMMFGNGAGFPGEWGDLMMTNIFRNSFQRWDFGTGAALSFVLMIVMMIIVNFWYKFYKSVEEAA